MPYWQRFAILGGVLLATAVVARLIDRRIARRGGLKAEAATRYRVLRRSVVTVVAAIGVLSALLDWGVLGNATGVEWKDGPVVAMSVFGGKLTTSSGFTGEHGIVTVRPNVVAAEPAAKKGTVEAAAAPGDRALPAVKVVERVTEAGGAAPMRRKVSSRCPRDRGAGDSSSSGAAHATRRRGGDARRRRRAGSTTAGRSADGKSSSQALPASDLGAIQQRSGCRPRRLSSRSIGTGRSDREYGTRRVGDLSRSSGDAPRSSPGRFVRMRARVTQWRAARDLALVAGRGVVHRDPAVARRVAETPTPSASGAGSRTCARIEQSLCGWPPDRPVRCTRPGRKTSRRISRRPRCVAAQGRLAPSRPRRE